MGIAFKGNKMAVATTNEVLLLGNAPQMAPNYPKQPNTYDALFLPRATYYTGALDIHDIEWIDDELWAVNTLFSCLSVIDEEYNFKPRWKPAFISDLAPEDRCHLNGLAMKDGQPKFVTALGYTNSPRGWRENKVNGGVIIDVESNEVVINGLAMPHSPRLYNNDLYALMSATGELIKVDTKKGEYEVVKKFDGFVRGMAKHGDYLFVALSRLRENSSSFNDLSISKRSLFCGIVVLHLPTAGLIGFLKYENSVDEIYDIKIIPGFKRPGLLNHEKPEHNIAISSPDGDFWAVKKEDEKNIQ